MPNRMDHSESGFMDTAGENYLNMFVGYFIEYLLGAWADRIAVHYLP